MLRKLKTKFIHYLIKNLLVAVTEEEILTVTNKGWFRGNRPLTAEEKQAIIDDARSFRDSEVWKLMSNEIRWMANLRMFEKGTTAENTIFGRAMLYNLELIEKFIRNCK